MVKKFICFASFSQKNRTIDLSNDTNKTVAAIKSDLKLDAPLWIKSPYFMRVLEDSAIPAKLFPKLVLSDRPDVYSRPEWYIFVNPNMRIDTWIVYAKISAQNDPVLPLYPLRFDNDSTIDTLFEQVKSCKGFEITPHELIFDDAVQSKRPNCDIIFDGTKPHTITLKCEIPQSTQKRINMRINIISEIIETEKTYVGEIDKITSFWKPNLVSCKMLNESEEQLLFKDFPSIYDYHSRFLSVLQEKNTGFSTEIAIIFLEFSQFFKISVRFISNYQQFNDLITKKMKTKSFNDKLNELAKQCHGIDLMSHLITPIQRMPRYVLFLRELIKYTPASHPDVEFLQAAYETIVGITQEIDAITQKAEDQSSLISLQKKIGDNILVVAPSRKIISTHNIKIKGQSDKNGFLYLFNDIVFVLTDQYRPLYDSSIDNFHYFPIDFKSILVSAINKPYNSSMMHPRKDYIIIFQNKNMKTEFLDKISIIQREHFNKVSETRTLEWEMLTIPETMPSLLQHAAVCFNDNILFFGGCSDKDKVINSDIFQFDFENSTMITMYSGILGRRHHTITLYENYIYIFGGFVKNREVPEIIKFDLETRHWEPITEFSFKQIGHTAVLNEDKIYLFGGKNVSQLSNDLFEFDINSKTLKQIEVKGSKPPARYNHSCVYFDNQLFIYGGKNNSKSLFNDLWSFDMKSKEWKRRATVQPRSSHYAVVLGNEMLIIGGISNVPNVSPSLSINLMNYEVCNILDLGNNPGDLKHFAAAVDSKGDIVLYGGKEFRMLLPCHFIYKVVVSQKWLEKSNADLIIAKANPRSKVHKRDIVKGVRLDSFEMIPAELNSTQVFDKLEDDVQSNPSKSRSMSDFSSEIAIRKQPSITTTLKLDQGSEDSVGFEPRRSSVIQLEIGNNVNKEIYLRREEPAPKPKQRPAFIISQPTINFESHTKNPTFAITPKSINFELVSSPIKIEIAPSRNFEINQSPTKIETKPIGQPIILSMPSPQITPKPRIAMTEPRTVVDIPLTKTDYDPYKVIPKKFKPPTKLYISPARFVELRRVPNSPAQNKEKAAVQQRPQTQNNQTQPKPQAQTNPAQQQKTQIPTKPKPTIQTQQVPQKATNQQRQAPVAQKKELNTQAQRPVVRRQQTASSKEDEEIKAKIQQAIESTINEANIPAVQTPVRPNTQAENQITPKPEIPETSSQDIEKLNSELPAKKPVTNNTRPTVTTSRTNANANGTSLANKKSSSNTSLTGQPPKQVRQANASTNRFQSAARPAETRASAARANQINNNNAKAENQIKKTGIPAKKTTATTNPTPNRASIKPTQAATSTVRTSKPDSRPGGAGNPLSFPTNPPKRQPINKTNEADSESYSSASSDLRARSIYERQIARESQAKPKQDSLYTGSAVSMRSNPTATGRSISTRPSDTPRNDFQKKLAFYANAFPKD